MASTGSDEDIAADLADPSNVIWTYEKVGTPVHAMRSCSLIRAEIELRFAE